MPAFQNATGWSLEDIIGNVGWFGFLLTFLTFWGSAVYIGVHSVRTRRAA